MAVDITTDLNQVRNIGIMAHIDADVADLVEVGGDVDGHGRCSIPSVVGVSGDRHAAAGRGGVPGDHQR